MCASAGLMCRLPPTRLCRSRPTGERVFVSGRMINGAFVPDVVTGGKGLPFDSGVSDVSLEGYLSAASGPVKIQGATVDGASLPAGVAADDRIVVTGRVSAPDQITATAITKIRTVVTIMKARGSQRPAATRVRMPNAPSAWCPSVRTSTGRRASCPSAPTARSSNARQA